MAREVSRGSLKGVSFHVGSLGKYEQSFVRLRAFLDQISLKGNGVLPLGSRANCTIFCYVRGKNVGLFLWLTIHWTYIFRTPHQNRRVFGLGMFSPPFFVFLGRFSPPLFWVPGLGVEGFQG